MFFYLITLLLRDNIVASIFPFVISASFQLLKPHIDISNLLLVSIEAYCISLVSIGFFYSIIMQRLFRKYEVYIFYNLAFSVKKAYCLYYILCLSVSLIIVSLCRVLYA
jgi:hypothetical protein